MTDGGLRPSLATGPKFVFISVSSQARGISLVKREIGIVSSMGFSFDENSVSTSAAAHPHLSASRSETDASDPASSGNRSRPMSVASVPTSSSIGLLSDPIPPPGFIPSCIDS